MERDVNSEAGNYGQTRTAMKKKKKKKKKKQGHGGNGDGNRMKKGFSDEQVRRLETMFETETKPEPRKKVELARELGLQPRQVAIWFQNRRARWKSKQLEWEYRSLKCNYDKLSVECESLKKEKQNLRSELQRLSCMLGRPCDRTTAGDDDPVGTFCGGGHDANFICGHECFDRKRTFCPQLHEGTIENSVEDMRELLQKAGDEDDGGSLTDTPEKWCGFGSSETPSDYHSCTNNAAAQWWNFCN